MIAVEDYKKMTEEERVELIRSSRQQEEYRKPLVTADLSFSEEEWLKLSVVEVREGWFSRREQNIELHTYRERSQQKIIRGVVMMFHGMTSHTNEGAYVAQRLAARGYEVVGFDQRGFGKSGGIRGYIKDFATIQEDSSSFLEAVRRHYPDHKLFVLGLSLGGLTSYTLGLNFSEVVSGCILMAPALRTFHGRAAYYFAKTFAWFCPNTKIPKLGRGGKRGSKNPNVSELRREDRYRYLENPYVRSLSSTLQGIDAQQQTFQRFNAPVLIIQGLRDNSLDPMGAVDLYERCSSTDKSIRLYGNLWHNVWQEEEIHEIMDEVIQWLDQRTR